MSGCKVLFVATNASIQQQTANTIESGNIPISRGTSGTMHRDSNENAQVASQMKNHIRPIDPADQYMAQTRQHN